jgi:hypothetical protein
MTIEEIRQAITASPVLKGMLPDTHAIAAALSEGRTKLVPTLITERRILSELGVVEGEQFLSSLEAFAADTLPNEHPLKAFHPGIKRAIGWLKSPQGIDVGDAMSQTMLNALAAAQVVTTTSATKVRNLAVVTDPVSEMDVRKAVWDDYGTVLIH